MACSHNHCLTLLRYTTQSTIQTFFELHKNACMLFSCRRKSKTYEVPQVKVPMLHLNKRIFVCSCPSLEVQFRKTDRKGRKDVSRFLSLCDGCFKTLDETKRNRSIKKQQVFTYSDYVSLFLSYISLMQIPLFCSVLYCCL